MGYWERKGNVLFCLTCAFQCLCNQAERREFVFFVAGGARFAVGQLPQKLPELVMLGFDASQQNFARAFPIEKPLSTLSRCHLGRWASFANLSTLSGWLAIFLNILLRTQFSPHPLDLRT